MSNQQSPLDSFEHVVVLMLENRSFDNMLGYLYQTGVPPGKQFAGVVGNNLANPDENGNPVPVSVQTNFHQPYPDPGEEFDHITAQLFSGAPPVGVPQMQGFVKDYFNTLTGLPKWPGSACDQSKAIMQCFTPSSIPVLSGLAQQFAVFDHWFCAVPSQTWCNRAFWHAATSCRRGGCAVGLCCFFNEERRNETECREVMTDSYVRTTERFYMRLPRPTKSGKERFDRNSHRHL